MDCTHLYSHLEAFYFKIRGLKTNVKEFVFEKKCHRRENCDVSANFCFRVGQLICNRLQLLVINYFLQDL